MIIENGNFKVYIHTNKTNGKMYVGITGRSVIERWNNGHGYVGSTYFYNAIKKYGWNNFDHEVFADNLTEQEAMHMEELLIRKLRLQDSKYGYNIRYGGTNCSLAEETKVKIGDALRGRPHSEKVRRMQSEIKKGKKLSPEHAAAISRGNKGRPRTEKEMVAARINGDKMSGDNHWTRRIGIKEETKQKISESMKEYCSEHQHVATNKKQILQVETGVVFNCIEDAAKAIGACRSQISEAAAGSNHHKTAKGYHWKFIESLETSRET